MLATLHVSRRPDPKPPGEAAFVAVCSLDRPQPELAAVALSTDEKAFASAARSRRRQREIDVTRRMLRLGLDRCLGEPAAPLAWTGRGPEYDRGGEGPGLSIAHAREFAAAALSRGGAVGVDIEGAVPARPWRRIAQTVFCDADRDWILAGIDEPARARRFLAVWTAREAFAKFRRESVFDCLSRPLLRAREPGSTVRRGDALVAVFHADDWTLALCGAGAAVEAPRWFLHDTATGAPKRPEVCFEILREHALRSPH